jgi:Ca2+-binding RTX toxin-like protein
MGLIFGTNGKDTLPGTPDGDVFIPYAGDDMISALAGNDTIWGGNLGNATVDLGTGADEAHLADGNNTVIANADTGPGALGDIIIVGSGSDTIYAGGGSNWIVAGGGNDVVYWVEGVGGEIRGGEGTDTFDMSQAASGHVILAAAGNVVGEDLWFGGFEKLVGTDQDDTIWGGLATIEGGAGNDYINVYGGAAATIDGGTGDDVIIGSAGADLLLGGDGDDYIAGAGGQDTIFGGDGKDDIHLGDGGAEAHGGSGNDTIIGGSGADKLFGDEGDDYLAGGDGDTVDGGEGNDRIELSGSVGATAFGGAGDDTIIGSDGADTIDGGSGSNYIVAGAGNDVIFIHGSWNYVIGGEGFDTADLSDSTADLSIDLKRDPSFAFDLNLVSIEAVKAGSGSDTITGSDVGNLLDGGAGNDEITGGAGNDTIIGGLGDDVLTGGAGSNTFVFGGNFGGDLILDFKIGQDKVELKGITADQITWSADGEIASGSNHIFVLADGNLSLSDFIFS